MRQEILGAMQAWIDLEKARRFYKDKHNRERVKVTKVGERYMEVNDVPTTQS